jgi:antitoxin component of MazEF toxin-antitoxin module
MEPDLFEQLLQSALEANTIKLSNEAREQLNEVLSNPRKSTYTLEELLSQCDEDAPIPEDFELWDKMKPVGNELIQD